MKRIAMTCVLAAIVFGSGMLWAEDQVYFRESGKKKDSVGAGTIEEESPRGIKLKTKSEGVKSIPAATISQVEYGNKIVDKIRFRAPDGLLQKAMAETKADKKAEQLRAAQISFETLDNIEQDGTKLSSIAPIHRYLQYRIAQTKALQARDDPSKRDAAIAALMEFKTNFADGWQIVPALQTLASLQVDKGDVEAAGQTYSALAEISGIAPEMKLQSQLQASRLLLRAGKFADAERKLTQVETTLSANDPRRTFVSVYLIQSRIAQNGNLDGVDKNLEEVVRKSKDNSLLALAHNALGDFYRAKKDNERAFWEYCKVDMLYDQDKEENAKALYYLTKLFAQAPHNNADRAESCRKRLLSTSFDGTLYQRLAAGEMKKE